MKLKLLKETWGVIGMVGLLSPAIGLAGLVDFGDLPSWPEGYYNGADGAGGFVSGGIDFPTAHDATWGVWSGFGYSRLGGTEISQADRDMELYFSYQYQSASGGAFVGDTYGVVFASPPVRLELPVGRQVPVSLAVTNSLYTWASMTYGDSFAKQFRAEDDDFFALTIRGLGAGDIELGSVDVLLADFRAADAAEHFILDDWKVVDLTGLGEGVEALAFSLASNDMGDFGMNTPGYFVIDALEVIPEPGTYAAVLGLCALAVAVGLRRRRG